MRFHPEIFAYTEALLRLIYPSLCGVCESLLELEEKGICEGCQGNLTRLRFSLPESCLETRLKNIREAWALYPYESPVKEILAAVKFSGKRWLLKTFAQDLEIFGAARISENHYDAIVPVPVDSQRRLERQFNQAELLAASLAKGMKIKTQNILRKRYNTPAQSRLGERERQMNLFHAFRISNPRQAAGKTILLVDDVLTTGATAQEAARTLKEAGAKYVDLVTLACTSRETAPQNARVLEPALSLSQ